MIKLAELRPKTRKILDSIGIDRYSRNEIRQLLQLFSLRRLRAKNKALSFHSKFIRSGDLVFDIGANVGSRSSLYLSLGATVIAAEPLKECVEMLERKFRKYSKVTIVPHALGTEEGEMTVFVSPDSFAVSSMSPQWIAAVQESGRFSEMAWTDQRSVLVTTLDSLIKQFGSPAFIKIDVEGYELNVLKGLSNVVPLISFEFTPEFLEPTERCVRYLTEMSGDRYRFNYSVGESMEFALDEWVDCPTIIRLLRDLPLEVFGDVYARAP